MEKRTIMAIEDKTHCEHMELKYIKLVKEGHQIYLLGDCTDCHSEQIITSSYQCKQWHRDELTKQPYFLYSKNI